MYTDVDASHMQEENSQKQSQQMLKQQKHQEQKKVLTKINKIYAFERKLKDLPPEERQKQRLEHIKPVLDDFYSWAEKLVLSANTKLSKAVQYVINEKKYLYEFLSNPNIPIDNNIAERAIKPFVIGRKNWLFSTSVKGGKPSQTIYSIVTTAAANELDIKEYLRKVFSNRDKLILPIGE